MPSEIKHFLSFLTALEQQNVLDGEEVAEALEALGGIEGVVRDRFFISGYENLGWYICKKMPLDELSVFCMHNTELLMQHAAARYYFAQALIEKPGLALEGCKNLILCMPDNYQKYLLKRFIES